MRHALDRAFEDEWADTSAAAAAFLARQPIDLGDWEDAKGHIDDSLTRGA
ncbi:hypothetical protein BH23ACT9_BH23ACT9_14510 [soil metagenome]